MEGWVRVVDVCSQGMDKGKHAVVSLSVLEARRHAEGIAVAVAVAAVAPCRRVPSVLLPAVKAFFKAAWRGKATRKSLALRFAQPSPIFLASA